MTHGCALQQMTHHRITGRIDFGKQVIYVFQLFDVVVIQVDDGYESVSPSASY